MRKTYLACGALLLSAWMVGLGGCYSLRPSAGGGQASFNPPRAIRPADIALPAGYRIEPVITGLTFPSDVELDEDGHIYVTEAGYSYGESWTTPRLLRIGPGGQATTIATGGKNGPWNGVALHKGAFYIAEGGELQGGRILRVTEDGKITSLIEGLPSMGDHHTNGPVIGPDGWLYFGQGTVTNSGVVGEDNLEFGWLPRRPEFHDTPCHDVTLSGQNFETADLLAPNAGGHVSTGAYSPFGISTTQGQVIQGHVPCGGAILRIRPDGGQPDLVAWGLRNPFGLAFSPEARLYVTENSYDDRGSRPVWGTGDVLWAITEGSWYGWPDFAAGHELTAKDYQPPGKPRLTSLLAKYPNKPPRPAASLGVHSSSDGFDFSRSAVFGHQGEAFIAQFGDMAPGVGKVLSPVGFKVVRVDVKTGVIEDFAVNKGKINGPASLIGGRGLERPVAARFDPNGNALYVVDFGVMTMDGKKPVPQPGTGVLWRITREGER